MATGTVCAADAAAESMATAKMEKRIMHHS
jgi:hypothetical protein